MRKKLLYIFLSALIVSVLPPQRAGAAEKTPAHEDAMFRAETADEENSDAEEGPNRQTQALERALDLSTAETRNIKTRLLVLDRDFEEDEAAWRDRTVASLEKALQYFMELAQRLARNPTEKNAQLLAEEFKNWREINYLPVRDEANDFLLVVELDGVLRKAESRAQRIGEDMKMLERRRFRGVAALSRLYRDAAELIEEARNLHTMAEKSLEVQRSPSEARSLFSTIPFLRMFQKGTAQYEGQEETAVGQRDPSPLVKDIVSASLKKVRGAYKVFLEMSSFVQKGNE